jgi:hypothetical protein
MARPSKALRSMVLRCPELSLLVRWSPARWSCSQAALRRVLAMHRELLPASLAEPARSMVRMALEPARPALEPKVCMAAAADWG